MCIEYLVYMYTVYVHLKSLKTNIYNDKKLKYFQQKITRNDRKEITAIATDSNAAVATFSD